MTLFIFIFVSIEKLSYFLYIVYLCLIKSIIFKIINVFLFASTIKNQQIPLQAGKGGCSFPFGSRGWIV